MAGRLFCITSPELEASPIQNAQALNFQTSEWFPTLKTLSTSCLMSKLSETLAKEKPRSHNSLWKNELWIKVKTYLHDLPIKILDEIYDQILHTDEDSISFQNSCQNCSRLGSMLKCQWNERLSDPELSFLMFWLFFDEKQTKVIKNQNISSSELMEYLSTVETSLTSARGDYFLWLGTSFQIPISQIAKNWSLSSLTFKGPTCLVRKMVNPFFQLLTSQSESLQELILDVDEIFSFVDLRFNDDLWKILAKMPNLSKVHLSGYQLHYLTQSQEFHPDGNNSLRNVKTLSVDLKDLRFFDFFQKTHQCFPSLKDVHLKISNLDSSGSDESLVKVSQFHAAGCSVHPFEILGKLKNAKSVHLSCNPRKQHGSRYFPEFASPEVSDFPSVVDLELNFPKKSIRFDEFLDLFKRFPKVATLTCNFYGIKNFEEKSFCSFLVENKASFANLRKIKLNFQNVVSGMTFHTVKTLMDNSNVRHFENIFNIPLSNEDLESLNELSKSKNLILLPTFQSKSADSSSWISCRQGRHIPIFPDISSEELFSDSDTSSSLSSSSSDSSESDSSILDFSSSDSFY